MSESKISRHLIVVGAIDRYGGSIATAHHQMVEQLLEAGYRITSLSSATDPHRLTEQIGFVKHPQFRVLIYRVRRLPYWVQKILPAWGNLALRRILEDSFESSDQKRLARSVVGTETVDGVLFLGRPSEFTIGKIPSFSFIQSLPSIEWQAMNSNRHTLSLWDKFFLLQLWRLYYLYRKRIDYLRLKQSAAIFVLCEWLTAEVKKLGLNKPITVVRFPFDFSRFDGKRSEKQEPPLILWLGRIVPRKRIDLFLEALRILKLRDVSYKAIVIGNVSVFSSLKKTLAAADNEGLITHMEYMPHQEVPELLAMADVLVQPSEWEPLGNSVVEALAAGCKPVIGPTNGTLPKNHPLVFWFKEYSAVSVAEAISQALENELPEDKEALKALFSAATNVKQLSETMEIHFNRQT